MKRGGFALLPLRNRSASSGMTSRGISRLLDIWETRAGASPSRLRLPHPLKLAHLPLALSQRNNSWSSMRDSLGTFKN